MNYARNYERCCLERPNRIHRWFMDLLTRKAQAIGQKSHHIWSLKHALDHYLPGRSGLRVVDCGAWNGWFLSYEVPAIKQRIALDFDPHFACELRSSGIDFVLADMEKGCFPFAKDTVDLLAMTSTLEHLDRPGHIATEIGRVLRPGGVVFITVPNILKYRFHFWDDITHKQPFNATSLRFLFESHGLDTVELCPYNHNLFIAGNLFPEWIHRRLMRFCGKAVLYVGRKPRK